MAILQAVLPNGGIVADYAGIAGLTPDTSVGNLSTYTLNEFTVQIEYNGSTRYLDETNSAATVSVVDVINGPDTYTLSTTPNDFLSTDFIAAAFTDADSDLNGTIEGEADLNFDWLDLNEAGTFGGSPVAATSGSFAEDFPINAWNPFNYSVDATPRREFQRLTTGNGVFVQTKQIFSVELEQAAADGKEVGLYVHDFDNLDRAIEIVDLDDALLNGGFLGGFVQDSHLQAEAIDNIALALVIGGTEGDLTSADEVFSTRAALSTDGSQFLGSSSRNANDFSLSFGDGGGDENANLTVKVLGLTDYIPF